MSFLEVFEVVEYEYAIIPKLSFLTGGGGVRSVNRQLGETTLQQIFCALYLRRSYAEKKKYIPAFSFYEVETAANGVC